MLALWGAVLWIPLGAALSHLATLLDRGVGEAASSRVGVLHRSEGRRLLTVHLV